MLNDFFASPVVVGWATLVVYLLLAFIAALGLRQITELNKQNVIQSFSMIYNVLLGDDMFRVRRFVVELQDDLKKLKADGADIAQYQDLFREKGKSLSARYGAELEARDVERLLAAFNNVGLLFQEGVFSHLRFPAAAQANVHFYWSLLEGYVQKKRVITYSYGIHSEFWARRSQAYLKEAIERYEQACLKLPLSRSQS